MYIGALGCQFGGERQVQVRVPAVDSSLQQLKAALCDSSPHFSQWGIKDIIS